MRFEAPESAALVLSSPPTHSGCGGGSLRMVAFDLAGVQAARSAVHRIAFCQTVLFTLPFLAVAASLLIGAIGFSAS